MDVLTPKQRKKCMAAIKGKDTRPKLIVRAMLDTLHFRYALHRTDLPGKPDVVFPRRKKIIFVHGCFWHLHRCRYGRVKPATNRRFWKDKLQKDRLLDHRSREALRVRGWQSLVVWECWTRDPEVLRERLRTFLAL